MICKYAKTEFIDIPAIGGSRIETETLCQIKLTNIEKQLELCSKLFKLGLEGSMLNNNCPVAYNNNWDACPYSKI